MRKAAIISLIIAGISIVLAAISRLVSIETPILPGGVLPITLLKFTNTCLLATIAFALLEKK